MLRSTPQSLRNTFSTTFPNLTFSNPLSKLKEYNWKRVLIAGELIGVATTVSYLSNFQFDADALESLRDFLKHNIHSNILAPLAVLGSLGSVSVVNFLFQNRDDILSYAVKNNKLKLAKLALKAGANIYEMNSLGETLLHQACKNGSLEIAQLLLDQKIDTEVVDLDGNTPLHLAVRHRHGLVVQALCKRGANLEAQNNQNEKAFPVNLLLAKAYGNQPALTKFLIESGIDLNSTTPGGRSLLHIACKHGQEEVVKYLLKKQVNLELRDIQGNTPLQKACQLNHPTVAKELIEHRANINTKNDKGLTPLHHASFFGHLSCVEVLIDNNANIEAKNNTEDTPLHVACFKNQREVAIFLSSKGANPWALNRSLCTPAFYAESNGFLEKIVSLPPSAA